METSDLTSRNNKALDTAVSLCLFHSRSYKVLLYTLNYYPACNI